MPLSDGLSIEQIIDFATDELAEVLADFDLSDEEFIKVRKVMKERIEKTQNLLLPLLNELKAE